ncbi:MAG TPA: hypothetical protein VGR10_03210, partial [Thermoleophilaceae bacterium]|nr:hypothetical protein [Thermoleophilaceae bacterium]
VDPLVEASEPVVSKPGPGNDLQELLPLLRAFVTDAEPAIADLDRTIRRPGKVNDVIDLQATFPPLATAALDTRRRTVNPAAVAAEGTRSRFDGKPRNVGRVPGAFPETVDALNDSAPIIAQGRPYTPDLWGWFDDFSHTGGYDALGGINRAEVIFNESSLKPNNDPNTVNTRNDVENVAIGQYLKCPGAAELPVSGNVFSLAEQKELDCKESDRQTGNYVPNSDAGKFNRVGPAGNPPSR